jgi:hypothetical protein
MTRPLVCLVGWVGSLLVLASGTSWGQQTPYPYARPGFSPYSRPQLSPYLNMLRGGSPAANYYMGVRPEFDRRATNLEVGTALQDLERRTVVDRESTDELVPTLSGTGHPVQFLNVSPYYNLNNLPRSTVTPPPGTPQRGRRAR